jgi:hypothetical protein
LSRLIPNTIPSVCWANTEEAERILADNLPGSTEPRAHLADGNRAVPGRVAKSRRVVLRTRTIWLSRLMRAVASGLVDGRRVPARALGLGIRTIRHSIFQRFAPPHQYPRHSAPPCKLLVLEL